MADHLSSQLNELEDQYREDALLLGRALSEAEMQEQLRRRHLQSAMDELQAAEHRWEVAESQYQATKESTRMSREHLRLAKEAGHKHLDLKQRMASRLAMQVHRLAWIEGNYTQELQESPSGRHLRDLFLNYQKLQKELLASLEDWERLAS
jgi:hypothetical protein